MVLLKEIDHARVAQELNERILIADLESSGIPEYAKRPLRRLQQDFGDMKRLEAKWKRDGKNPSNVRKQLKEVAIEQREPLANMYLEHCEALFEPLKKVVIVTDAEMNFSWLTKEDTCVISISEKVFKLSDEVRWTTPHLTSFQSA